MTVYESALYLRSLIVVGYPICRSYSLWDYEFFLDTSLLSKLSILLVVVADSLGIGSCLREELSPVKSPFDSEGTTRRRWAIRVAEWFITPNSSPLRCPAEQMYVAP
jgi:hypothetical protein